MIPAHLTLVVSLAVPVPASPPPPTPQDTATLEFLGFRAGARLDRIEGLVRRGDRGRMRCDRASVDPRVSECRGTIRDSALGGRILLWISAIDSVAGVITLSGPVEAAQLEEWRGRIERRYGPVDARVQGSQRMMQWVRRGRMLRLTWRIEKRGTTASVSLIDGRVLDAWGRTRAAAPSR